MYFESPLKKYLHYFQSSARADSDIKGLHQNHEKEVCSPKTENKYMHFSFLKKKNIRELEV